MSASALASAQDDDLELLDSPGSPTPVSDTNEEFESLDVLYIPSLTPTMPHEEESAKEVDEPLLFFSDEDSSDNSLAGDAFEIVVSEEERAKEQARLLAEEKAKSDFLAAEKDTIEREIRKKENELLCVRRDSADQRLRLENKLEEWRSQKVEFEWLKETKEAAINSIRQLKEENRSLEVGINGLNGRLEELRHVQQLLVEEKDKSVKLAGANERIEKQVLAKEEQLQDFRDQLQTQRDRLQASQKAVSVLEQQLQVVTRSKTEAETRIAEMEQAKSLLEEELREEEEYADELAQQNQLLRDAKAELEESSEAVKARFEGNLSAKEELAVEQQQSLLTRIEDLNQELKEQYKISNDAVIAKQRMSSELDHLERQLATLANNFDEAAKLSMQLQTQIKTYQMEVDDLKGQKDRFAEIWKVHEKEYKVLEARLLQVQIQATKLATTVTNVEKERDELKKKLEESIAEFSDATERLDGMDKDLGEQEELNYSLREKQQETQQERDKLLKDLDEERARVKRLDATLQRSEDDNEDLREQLEEIAADVRGECESEISSLTAQTKDFQAQLETETLEKMDLESDLKEAEQELMDERQKNDQQRELLKSLKAQKAAVEEECARERATRRKNYQDLQVALAENDKLIAELKEFKTGSRASIGGPGRPVVNQCTPQ